MRNKLFWLILVLAGCAILFSVIKGPSEDAVDFKPLEINVGDAFSFLEYPNPMSVINYMMKDVTGDDTIDMIIVVGEKEKAEEIFASNMDIVIYEPNEQKFYPLKLKNMNGEMAQVQAVELTGDGIPEIVLLANQSDGTIAIRVIMWEGERFQEILKAKDNRGIVFRGEFLDGFKAKIQNTKYQKDLTLDLKDRKENYVTNGFYDESGRLLQKDAKVETTPFISVEFVQLNDYDGIQTTQHIVGFNQEDLLEEITVIWKYEEGKWQVKEAKGMVIGNMLY